MVGRPRERARSIERGFFNPFLRGQTSVSSIRSEADWTSDGVKKHFYNSSIDIKDEW